MSRSEAIASGARRRQLTAEQRAASEQMRQLAKAHRFRVQLDLEGFPMIPGRYGQIEWFDGEDLGVYTNRRRLFTKLWAIPGVRRHQTGDTEMRAVFPLDALEHVADAIRARRRRTLSPEAARNLGAETAYRTTSEG